MAKEKNNAQYCSRTSLEKSLIKSILTREYSVRGQQQAKYIVTNYAHYELILRELQVFQREPATESLYYAVLMTMLFFFSDCKVSERILQDPNRDNDSRA